jgi:hypothetical protein
MRENLAKNVIVACRSGADRSGDRAPGRAGTPDEVGTVGALLMGSDGGLITGSDFLMDGGVTASYWYGEPAAQMGDNSNNPGGIFRN